MKIYAGRVLLHAILIGISLTVCEAQAFLFVSPNTVDSMPDEAAAEALHSFEQSNFVAVAKYLAGKLCRRPQVSNAEGVDGGMAENSTLITGCRFAQAGYLGELLGRYAHQKSVLIFDPSPTGTQHLFMVAIPNKRSTEVLKDMRDCGMKSATIVQEDTAVRVYLWSKDNSEDSALHSLTESEHGTLQDLPGTGTLIGGVTRAAAQRVFDRDIRLYEKAHRQLLSKLLWSKWLHDLGLAETILPSLPSTLRPLIPGFAASFLYNGSAPIRSIAERLPNDPQTKIR